jgi:hypothetical protein
MTALHFEGDTAVLEFRGPLDPAMAGAKVTMRDRMEAGKIIEEWGEFQVEQQ